MSRARDTEKSRETLCNIGATALSDASKSLWGKSEHGGAWVPLYVHMAQSAQVASDLWQKWLSAGTRRILERGTDSDTAARLPVFLAATHDLGKATPPFQLRPSAGADLRARVCAAGFPKLEITGNDWHRVKHALASQAILERFGIDRRLAVTVGGHHGIPPSQEEAHNASPANNAHAERLGFTSERWAAAQHELYRYALALSGLDADRLKGIRLSLAQQMLYSGIVILSDWIASDADGTGVPARGGFADSDFSRVPYDFEARFGFSANALQAAVIDASLNVAEFGIMVAEGLPGSGKTEAALAATEISASRTCRGGGFFALPTQASADGIFPRFTRWIGRAGGNAAHSVFLAHGKSAYNKEYEALRRYNVSADDDADGGVYVNEWMTGRKKGLLSDFAVGTVDQLLMCALKQRHAALRHLGLANKVVVIDEVHAYDAYMDSYLYKALRWLGEYGVPVIVLSATLPLAVRQKLIESYLGKSFATPINVGGCVSFQDGRAASAGLGRRGKVSAYHIHRRNGCQTALSSGRSEACDCGENKAIREICRCGRRCAQNPACGRRLRRHCREHGGAGAGDGGGAVRAIRLRMCTAPAFLFYGL